MSFAEIIKGVEGWCLDKPGTPVNPLIQETQDLRSVLKRNREESVPYLEVDSPIRISSLPYLCPRREVICKLHKVVRTNKLDAGTQVVYGMGSNIHTLLQNEFFGPELMLLGRWKCLQCGTVTTEISVLPTACTCGTSFRELVRDPETGNLGRAYEYQEETVVDPDLGLRGHCDGLLLVQGKKRLLEVKSIRGDLFSSITEPYEGNVIQMTAYMKLLNLDLGSLVFINKNARGNSDLMREFTVPFDQKVWDKIENQILLLRKCLADGTLPPIEQCLDKKSVKARSCQVRNQCFGKAS